jgi:hypothetical protein
LKGIVKFVAHSRLVLSIAAKSGWLPAARYTNLRDVRSNRRPCFLDIDWKNYDFRAHLTAVRATRPLITVARDVEKRDQLPRILDQAEALAEHAAHIVIVPKDPSLGDDIARLIPGHFILGYSVPTRYGGTKVPLNAFAGRRVHLLGGRPDTQRALADTLDVVSIDCNRFTLDAQYGDYFDGQTFRPHPRGGYRTCIAASIRNIDRLWSAYRVSMPLEVPDDRRRSS